MPIDKRKAMAGLVNKLKSALEVIKRRAPKSKLPSLEALRVYINKMKPKNPNAPRKINYHGGVFKLASAPIVDSSSDQLRIKEAWEKGVKGVPHQET